MEPTTTILTEAPLPPHKNAIPTHYKEHMEHSIVQSSPNEVYRDDEFNAADVEYEKDKNGTGKHKTYPSAS